MQSVLFIAIIKIKKNYVKLLRLCWTVFQALHKVYYKQETSLSQVLNKSLARHFYVWTFDNFCTTHADRHLKQINTIYTPSN